MYNFMPLVYMTLKYFVLASKYNAVAVAFVTHLIPFSKNILDIRPVKRNGLEKD